MSPSIPDQPTPLEEMTEPQLAQLMNDLAGVIHLILGDRIGERPRFTLLLWNDPALGQYISNCNRDDMIQALRETADRLERNEDVPR